MRDGQVLYADVYLPDEDAAVPALLTRTPYDVRRSVIAMAAIDLERATAAGFAVVVQDVRGRGRSEGVFLPFVGEGEDTYDSVEWTAAQSWCSGEVGMTGRSYPAAVQLFGAVEQPPHLRAIAPVITGSETYEGSVYQGGAFLLGFNLFWVRLIADPKRTGALDSWNGHLPLGEIPDLVGNEAAAFYADWLKHPAWDEYWAAQAVNRQYNRIEVPGCHVSGWYDIFLGGTLENYRRLRQEAGTKAAREGQRLVIGPWAHGAALGAYPDHRFDAFPEEAYPDLTDLQVRFFDRHLRGADTPMWEGDDAHPVRLFVMGANEWRTEPAWPLARAEPTAWYLHGRGGLSSEIPAESAEPSRYSYDPANPAPTMGGPTSLPGRMMRTDQGPRDQSPLEARPDVLVFTSDVLVTPIEVTGPISALLHFATSTPDTDVVVKLCDVGTDGRSIVLAEGVQRCRFRHGRDREVPMVAGRPEAITVDLVATSNVFAAGHRIRIDVTSSSFPRFDRNPNTGHRFGTDGPDDVRVAEQSVFHTAERPSHVVLPIVPA
jgi:putative CocE/NonD family hydrolase